MSIATIETDVMIVGAGPTGLSLAIELGLRGLRVLLIERNPRTGVQPRAKTTNVRSMEHMRRWGIADRLRDAAPLAHDYPTDVVFATRLFGRTLAVIENAFEGAKRRDLRFPEPAQWVPQYTVEAVLRERAAALPSVRLAFSTEFGTATWTEDGVTATVRRSPDGPVQSVSARFLVGADGARSRVRELIGARMEGQHAFALNYNLILHIPDLAREPPERRAIMYWLVNADSAGVMGPMDADGRWYFNTSLPPGVQRLDEDTIRRRVREAVGRDVEVEILSDDIWAAHRLIADRYRAGPVFLAGDACHLHPPFGGYGMNLGIADGVDLGWKLAATLGGWAGPRLLDSYERERRPVHQRTIAEAVENYRVLSGHLHRADLDEGGDAGERARAELREEIVATKTREFATLGVVLGSRYADSPIIVPDGDPPPEHHADYRASSCPGCLAPHAWLEDGASLYDRLGPGYTLLILGDEGPAARLVAAARAADLPLTVLKIDDPELRSLYGAPFALIRPDQHVAWRGSDDSDAERVVAIVAGREHTNARALAS